VPHTFIGNIGKQRKKYKAKKEIIKGCTQVCAVESFGTNKPATRRDLKPPVTLCAKKKCRTQTCAAHLKQAKNYHEARSTLEASKRLHYEGGKEENKNLRKSG
jgi:hypothetical protein